MKHEDSDSIRINEARKNANIDDIQPKWSMQGINNVNEYDT